MGGINLLRVSDGTSAIYSHLVDTAYAIISLMNLFIAKITSVKFFVEGRIVLRGRA